MTVITFRNYLIASVAFLYMPHYLLNLMCKVICALYTYKLTLTLSVANFLFENLTRGLML